MSCERHARRILHAVRGMGNPYTTVTTPPSWHTAKHRSAPIPACSLPVAPPYRDTDRSRSAMNAQHVLREWMEAIDPSQRMTVISQTLTRLQGIAQRTRGPFSVTHSVTHDYQDVLRIVESMIQTIPSADESAQVQVVWAQWHDLLRYLWQTYPALRARLVPFIARSRHPNRWQTFLEESSLRPIDGTTASIAAILPTIDDTDLFGTPWLWNLWNTDHIHRSDCYDIMARGNPNMSRVPLSPDSIEQWIRWLGERFHPSIIAPTVTPEVVTAWLGARIDPSAVVALLDDRLNPYERSVALMLCWNLPDARRREIADRWIGHSDPLVQAAARGLIYHWDDTTDGRDGTGWSMWEAALRTPQSSTAVLWVCDQIRQAVRTRNLPMLCYAFMRMTDLSYPHIDTVVDTLAEITDSWTIPFLTDLFSPSLVTSLPTPTIRTVVERFTRILDDDTEDDIDPVDISPLMQAFGDRWKENALHDFLRKIPIRRNNDIDIAFHLRYETDPDRIVDLIRAMEHSGAPLWNESLRTLRAQWSTYPHPLRTIVLRTLLEDIRTEYAKDAWSHRADRTLTILSTVIDDYNDIPTITSCLHHVRDAILATPDLRITKHHWGLLIRASVLDDGDDPYAALAHVRTSYQHKDPLQVADILDIPSFYPRDRCRALARVITTELMRTIPAEPVVRAITQWMDRIDPDDRTETEDLIPVLIEATTHNVPYVRRTASLALIDAVKHRPGDWHLLPSPSSDPLVLAVFRIVLGRDPTAIRDLRDMVIRQDRDVPGFAWRMVMETIETIMTSDHLDDVADLVRISPCQTWISRPSWDRRIFFDATMRGLCQPPDHLPHLWLFDSGAWLFGSAVERYRAILTVWETHQRDIATVRWSKDDIMHVLRTFVLPPDEE